MKLKTVTIEGKTYAEIDGDKPVFTDDTGKDIPFDAPGTIATISRLNAEAKGHRERAEKAEAGLRPFEGIKDPAAAIKALETVSSLDQKRLIDAGEVDKVKAEAIKAVEERFAPVVAENEKLKGELFGEKIGGAFSRSKLIADKFAIPADIVQARFGANFKIEDGKVVAYDQAGNKLYSKASPGNPADFEEALGLLVEAYPYKDSILKGNVAPGGGANNSNAHVGAKTMSTADFNKLDAKTRAAKMAEAGFALTD